MKGYKIFDKNFCCRGFQYAVGETATMTDDPVVCLRGFHFCIDAIDCVTYYKLDPGHRYAEVESDGTISYKDDKYATNRLRIVREIPYAEFRELCSGERISYHPGSRAKLYQRSYIDAQLHGVCTMWYDNGNKLSETVYDHGRLNGERKYWYSTGRPELTCTFQQDIATGTDTIWYESGGKRSECTYVGGFKNGPSYRWYENGDLESIVMYLNGVARPA